MPGKHNKPMMGHKPKMAHGNKPKMGHKPKMMVDISKVNKGQQGMIKSIVANAMMFKTPKQVKEVRPKMAMPKKNTPSNFPQMAQDMADVLVQKMDKAKMYKPTKYHDMPKMAHGDKPKMMAGDGKHTGKVVTIGGKKYDTRSSEYKALTSKKQAGKAQGANYIGGSKDGKPVAK